MMCPTNVVAVLRETLAESLGFGGGDVWALKQPFRLSLTALTMFQDSPDLQEKNLHRPKLYPDLTVGTFLPFCGPWFPTKPPNSEKGSLLILRLLGSL